MRGWLVRGGTCRWEDAFSHGTGAEGRGGEGETYRCLIDLDLEVGELALKLRKRGHGLHVGGERGRDE